MTAIGELRKRLVKLHNEMDEIRKEMIELFKKTYNIDIYTIVKTRDGYARVVNIYVDDSDDEVKASLKYPDEAGFWRLGRVSFIGEEDILNGDVIILPEGEELSQCVHLWEEVGPTGEYKEVSTFAGVVERVVYEYECIFCGERRTYP